MDVRKQLAFFCAILLFSQSIPLSLTSVYAETEDFIDPQQVEAFRSHQPEYLQLNQPMFPSEQKKEEVQEFSFVDKTFRTTGGQPVLVRFTCALPANEVLVRIPIEGQVVEEQFSNGESIQHSHGEYWVLKTSNQQSDFVLPVVFETAGQYFLTIDHDADHFYLEVEDEEEQVQAKNEDQPKAMNEFSHAAQPVVTAEQNLIISEELIAAENERILEETLDPSNRSTSSVRNWSQFRSAWNSSRTTEIRVTHNISYSFSITGSSLSARSTSVAIIGEMSIVTRIDFWGSSKIFEMNGSANLSIRAIEFKGEERIIKHNGSGLVDMTNCWASQSLGRVPVVEAQNINLSGGIRIRATGPTSAIYVVRGGTLTITPTEWGYITGDYGASNIGINIKPISSDASSRIILNTNRLTMGTPLESPRSSWNQVNATLSGVNGSQVVSSNSSPNDFAERYTQLFNESWYSSLIFNGSGSGFEPPIQTGTVTTKYVDSNRNELAQSESITGNVGTRYTTQPKDIDGWTLIEVPSNASGLFTQEPITVIYVYERTKWSLSLQASPTLGGAPSSDNETMSEKETTAIRANPNDEYRFVKWEIISGTNARITNETAENTTFTMGNSNVSIRAIYEKKTYNLSLSASPKGAGNPQSDKETLEVNATATIRANPNDEYRFVKWEIVSGTNARIANQTAENTTFTMGNSDASIRAIYEKELKNVNPLDPLYPDKEINPEKLPILPENQGLFSIDFVSQFDFGSQAISTQDKTYYAKPQQLVSEDGSVIEGESRPNYVQISDRRPENERNGWQLAVTQKEQFKGKENQELNGASLSLSNQQVVTAQGGAAPGLQYVPCVLIPGNRRTLLKAQGNEGTGTWIYRFGDADTQGESVALNVPKGAPPEATAYSTTLIWELSAVPKN